MKVFRSNVKNPSETWLTTSATSMAPTSPVTLIGSRKCVASWLTTIRPNRRPKRKRSTDSWRPSRRAPLLPSLSSLPTGRSRRYQLHQAFEQTNPNTQQRFDLSRDRSRTRHSSSRPSRPSNSKGRGKGKPSGHRGSPPSLDNRKHKEVTVANTNHNARNCYKRQEDEKKKSTIPHKQAHQSILVDETAFQFSKFVLSISHSDFNPHHHDDAWGEYTQEQEDLQEQDVQEEAQQRANEEMYQDTTSDETLLASPSTSGPGSI
jgi:hypothetical protein